MILRLFSYPCRQPNLSASIVSIQRPQNFVNRLFRNLYFLFVFIALCKAFVCFHIFNGMKYMFLQMFATVFPCGTCCKALACCLVSFSTLANIGRRSRRKVLRPLRLIQAQGRDRQYPVLDVHDGPEMKKTSDPKQPKAVQAYVSRQKQDWLPVLTPVDALYPKSFFWFVSFLVRHSRCYFKVQAWLFYQNDFCLSITYFLFFIFCSFFTFRFRYFLYETTHFNI